MPKKAKSKSVSDADGPLTQITAKERRKIRKSIKKKYDADFSRRYACDMFVVGADFCDFKTDDFEMIREYMKPIRR